MLDDISAATLNFLMDRSRYFLSCILLFIHVLAKLCDHGSMLHLKEHAPFLSDAIIYIKWAKIFLCGSRWKMLMDNSHVTEGNFISLLHNN